MLVVGTRRGDSDSLLSDISPKLKQLLGVWCTQIGLTEIPYIVQNNYTTWTSSYQTSNALIDVWAFSGGGDLLFIDLALMFNFGEIILLQYAEPNHF